MKRMQNKTQSDKIELLESQLWNTLLHKGFITSQSSNPQIIDIDKQIIQFVFIYQSQSYSGSASYQELNDFMIPRYQIQILSIDGPVQSVWNSTQCDYVWISQEYESDECAVSSETNSG